MNNPHRWQQQNDDYLEKALEWLRLRLRQFAHGDHPQQAKSFLGLSLNKRERESPSIEPVSKRQVDAAAKAMAKAAQANPQNPPALVLLSQKFGLSPFEQNVLLLCVAMELDPTIPGLCAQIQGDGSKTCPTFALVLSLFEGAAWDVLSPHRPLRWWRLIEINQPPSQPLTASALQADERIVNYVKGLNYLDDRLSPLLLQLELPNGGLTLTPTHQAAVADIVTQLQSTSPQQRLPMVQLVGLDSPSKQLVAS